jgi:hypothetical protein
MKTLTLEEIRGRQPEREDGAFATTRTDATVYYRIDNDNTVALSMGAPYGETDASQWFRTEDLDELIELLQYLKTRIA